MLSAEAPRWASGAARRCLPQSPGAAAKLFQSCCVSHTWSVTGSSLVGDASSTESPGASWVTDCWLPPSPSLHPGTGRGWARPAPPRPAQQRGGHGGPPGRCCGRGRLRAGGRGGARGQPGWPHSGPQVLPKVASARGRSPGEQGQVGVGRQAERGAGAGRQREREG